MLRKALVIGNENYLDKPLLTPINDANDIASLLSEKEFDVTVKHDLDIENIDREISTFCNSVKNGEYITLFYFAGHGVQVDGRNYLIPVGQDFYDETQIRWRAYPLDELIERISTNKKNTNIIILDACRNNPFEANRSITSSGLAEISASKGTFIAYATSPGKTASDSSIGGRNGLYTSHLLEAIRKTNLHLDNVFKFVREKVYAESNERQLPWVSNSLIGDFCFDTKFDMTVSLPADFRDLNEFEFSELTTEEIAFTKFINPARNWEQLIAYLEVLCKEGHSDRPFCVELLSQSGQVKPMLCMGGGGNVDYGYSLVSFEEYLERWSDYGCFSNASVLELAKKAPKGSCLYYILDHSERIDASKLVSWPSVLWEVEHTDVSNLGSFHASLINMVDDPQLKYPSIQQLLSLLHFVPDSKRNAYVKISIDNFVEDIDFIKKVNSRDEYILTGYCNVRKEFIGYDRRYCCIPDKSEWLTYNDLVNILTHIPKYQLKNKFQMYLVMGFVWPEKSEPEFEEHRFILGHLDSRINIPD
ncbi:hypothetical protein CSW98_09660 [Vibrio sp. HA2012]|uniref:caspase family protein n=1 Tax=Vibrio sp. HA2012 TaxID=1971595 RepID=UPI000C2C7EBC|nr:caspase family protein [Vibrio sp. HA2012]PJC86467.1 hypothetical protein CSW98_09660 [Vibrio sp. HA2012]